MKQPTLSLNLIFFSVFFLFGQAKASAQSFNLYQLPTQEYLKETTEVLAGTLSYDGFIFQAKNTDMLGFVSTGGMGIDIYGELEIFGDSLKEIGSSKFQKEYANEQIIYSNPILYYNQQMHDQFISAQKKKTVKLNSFGEALEKLYQAQAEVKSKTNFSPRI